MDNTEIMKAQVKKPSSLADTIEECNMEIDRILKIITWLKEMPVQEDYMKDYKLMRRLSKRIDKVKAQIQSFQQEDGENNEQIYSDYLRDSGLKWLRNTNIVAVITLAEDNF